MKHHWLVKSCHGFINRWIILLAVYSFTPIAFQSCYENLSLAWSGFVSSLVSSLEFFLFLSNKLISYLVLWCFVAIPFFFCFSTISSFFLIFSPATSNLWLVALVKASASLQTTIFAFFIFFSIQLGLYNWLNWF